jgi:hypothetical protein
MIINIKKVDWTLKKYVIEATKCEHNKNPILKITESTHAE